MEKAMEYILKIDKERSFSKAATKLYITQPALSAIVKKEEENYGVQFFNRNLKPIIPTAAGAKYIQTAEKIKKLEQQLKKELNTLHPTNMLTIGSAAFFCSNVIPHLTSNFLEYYSKHCPINTVEADPQGLSALLQNNTADFILTADTPPGKHEHLRLNKEHIILAVPKEYITDSDILSSALKQEDIMSGKYLQPEFPSLNLQSLTGLPFIILTKGNDMYTRAKKLLRTSNTKPKELIYMDQLQSSFLAAKNGKGVVFIRAELLKYLDGGDKLLFFKLDDPLCWREVNLYYKNKKRLSPTAQAFLSYCEKLQSLQE